MRKSFLIILTLFSLTVFSQTPLHSLLGADGFVCGDADGQKFIDSAGITNVTQKIAICTLVQQLKDSSLWTKFYAIYPVVGGTAASHKWNLKDIRDLDAAYRLVIAAGTSNSSNGMIGDGSQTVPFAKTFFVPSAVSSGSILSLCYYSRSNLGANNVIEMGAYDGSTKIAQLILRFGSAPELRGTLGDVNLAAGSAANTDTRGLYVMSRTSSTSSSIYKNGVNMGSNNTLNSVTAVNLQIYMGIRNGTTSLTGSVKECAFAAIGQGLTDAEVATLYRIVQAYETTLGRQV